ncbi:MAG: DUF1564 family protein [Leptospiraceae bacterium]|nr:DUF1564 family protein [Leptospiraceae bacterium]
MPEFQKNNSYKVETEGTIPFCLNMGKETQVLLQRKLIRCKTYKKAFQELLDRYESACWSGLILDPNVNLKTKYQVDALDSPVIEEKYERFTIRIESRDYARFRTLANFLRISMCLLFAFLLIFDRSSGLIFHHFARRSLALVRIFSFSTKIRFIQELFSLELLIKTPLERGG